MKKFDGISRIVNNASVLSNPTAAECFFYECEDYDGLASVMDEIDDLQDCLPDDVHILDLPYIYCGNKKTKIVGLATCDATQGHQFLDEDAQNRVVFEDLEEAIAQGYRPCKKCLSSAYLDWKKAHDK